jgi:TP901 family phage tail tape measure protein
MPNEQIGIRLQAQLNHGLSWGEINKNIKKLEKKVNKLKLKIDVDQKILKTLTDFNNNLNKINQTTVDQKKVVDNSTKALDKETKAIEKQTKELNKNAVMRKKIIENDVMTTTRTTTGSKFDNTTTSRSTFKDGTLPMNHKESIRNIDEAGAIRQRLADHKKMLDEAYRMNATHNKRIESLDRTHYMALKTNKEKIEAREKTHVIALQQNRDRDLRLQKQYQTMKNSIESQSRRLALDPDVDKGKLAAVTNEIQSMNKATPQAIARGNQLSRSLKMIGIEAKETAIQANTMGRQIGSIFAKFGLWLGVSAVIFSIARAAKDLVVQIKEIDTQMTELNRVAENFNLKETLQESVNIANDLGESIAEVNEAMIQASRMGLEGQALFGLTRAAVLMSSISDLNAEEALNNLSSTLVQFNMNASEAVDVVDKLNAVDNDYVTSTKDLAQSITKSGAVAKTFGIELNTLLGYTVAVSEATRETGNIIGNSIKSWATRITTMGGAISALKEVGIDVFDPITKQVNRVEDIIESLAGKWDTLGKSTQQSLSLLIAGRHHVSRFAGLMENYSSVADVVTTAVNGQGSAIAENIKYQQSLEGQLKKLGNSWTNFAIVLGESGVKDFFSTVIVSATNAMNAFAGLTSATNGLNLSLPILTVVLLASTKAMLGFAGSAKAAKISLGWIGAILIGLELLATAFIGTKKANEDNTGSMIENSQQMSATADQIDILVSKYEELRPQAEGSKKAQDELNTVMEQLQKIAPQLTGSLNDQNTSLDLNAQKAREYAESLRGMSKELLNVTQNTLETKIIDAENDLSRAKDGLDKYEEDYNEHLKKLKELQVAYNAETIQELEQSINDAIGVGKEGRILANDMFDFKDIKDALQDSGYEKELIKINELEGNVASLQDRKKSVEDLINGTDKLKTALVGVKEQEDSMSGEEENLFDQLSKSADNTISSINTLASAYQTLQNGEELSHDTLLQLISDYPKFAKYLNDNNGIIEDKGKLLEVIANFEREEQLKKEQRYLDDNEALWKSLNGKRRMYEQFYRSMILPQDVMDKIGSQMFTSEEQAQFDKMSAEREQSLARIAVLSEEIKLDSWNPSSRVGSPSPKDKSFNKHIVDEYAKSIASLDLLIAQSSLRQSKYNEESAEHSDEINLQIKLLKDKQSLISIEANRLRAQNVQLESQRKKLKSTSEEYNNLTKQIDDNENSINSLSNSWLGVENNIDSAKQSLDKFNEESLKTAQDNANAWEDNINKAIDSAIDKIKEHYEMQKKAALDAISKEKEAMDKAHRSFMDNKDEELSKYEEVINAQLRLINDQSDEDTFNKELGKKQKEQSKLQSQINKLSLDDSIESQAKKKDLELQLADLVEETEEFKLKRTKDLRRQNLQDNLDNKRKEIQSEKDTADKTFNIIKENLDDKAEEEEKFWQNEIENDAKFQEMRNQALLGNLSMLQGELNKFADNVNNKMFDVGENMRNNIVNSINSIKQALSNVGSLDTYDQQKRDAWNQYVDNKRRAELHFEKSKNETGTGVWLEDLRAINNALRAKYGFEDGSHAQLENKVVKFHEGGATSNQNNPLMKKLHELFAGKSGEIPSLLKNNEFVIPDAFSVARKLFTPQPQLNKSGAMSGGNTTINMPVTIGNLTGDRAGVNEFFSTIRTEMKKKGL